MTRDAAIALVCAVADAGYSCSLAIGVHRDMVPSEHCSVSVHAMRLEPVALAGLMALGEQHDVELHLISNELAFIDAARPRA